MQLKFCFFFFVSRPPSRTSSFSLSPMQQITIAFPTSDLVYFRVPPVLLCEIHQRTSPCPQQISENVFPFAPELFSLVPRVFSVLRSPFYSLSIEYPRKFDRPNPIFLTFFSPHPFHFPKFVLSRHSASSPPQIYNRE